MNKEIKSFLVGMIMLFLLLSSQRGLAELDVSFDFKYITPGNFYMGNEMTGEKIWVKITRPFEIMTTEVTQKQWFSVMGDNPSFFNRPEDCDDKHKYVETEKGQVVGLCPDHPVEQVSYAQVQEFINKLNEDKGDFCGSQDLRNKIGCVRLPTEAEWEYSARAGSNMRYCFGNDPLILKDFAIYRATSENRTHKVKSKTKNNWSLYDMYGNVWELVEDVWNRTLPGGEDPLVTVGHGHVIRGGSWNSLFERNLVSGIRLLYNSDFKSPVIGFRLVRNL